MEFTTEEFLEVVISLLFGIAQLSIMYGILDYVITHR